MFKMLNPPNLVRKLTSTMARRELSFQARAIARWDNEGGAPKASDEKDLHRAPLSDGDSDVSLMRPASPGSNSRELRARDDLYHQSFWKVQN
jgi:hypothetical protein